MSAKIPDRWIPYKAFGKVIDGTRIICFKVPLNKRVQKDAKNIWDINTLVKAIPKLGAVIDLTNTAKYYDPAELMSKGILYKKILVPGRQLPPEGFVNTVDKFLKQNEDWLIGVHCTHGLNRTGYMVCRYMRDRIGIPAKDAIKSFELARGYQIERKNFIADLLGKKPPPPDYGKNTAVKPIDNDSDINSSSVTSKQVDIQSASRGHKRLSWNEPRSKKWKRNRTISKSSTSSGDFDFNYDY